MDGQEFSEILLSKTDKIKFRLDSDYYSITNLEIEQMIKNRSGKTIRQINATMDCSAFYPSIIEYYDTNGAGIPFLRVNEISNGMVQVSENTAFLPQEVLDNNKNTIAIVYPGDIIIAKGGNTLAKVGLITNEYQTYAISRDVIALRTSSLTDVSNYYLWSYLHSSYGQCMLWRSASQTGQPHLTLPSIYDIKIPLFSDEFQEQIKYLYLMSVRNKRMANDAYCSAEQLLLSELGMVDFTSFLTPVAVKSLSVSFLSSGRLDAEYYQPKYDALFDALSTHPSKHLGGKNGIVSIKKSIEPGSDAYSIEGVPFVRISDLTTFGITDPEVKLSKEIVPNLSTLFPCKDTILFSKDGSVGIAYKAEKDFEVVTSGAILHLRVKKPKEILPDYLTLVLNSAIVQLQAERDSSGAIIKHWKPSEIEKVIIPILDISFQKIIVDKVQTSFSLRHQSDHLIEKAKRAVEIAIEQGECKALEWLQQY